MSASWAGNAGAFKSVGVALLSGGTRRRRILLFVLLAVVLGVGCLLAWRWYRPSPRINEAAYEQIRLGMTQPEVEAILGVKPGEYHSGAIDGAFQGSILVKDEKDEEAEEGNEERWESDEAGISVFFSPEGKVTAKYYAIRMGGQVMQRTLLERIKSLLGR
jgi:hypothetical protein